MNKSAFQFLSLLLVSAFLAAPAVAQKARLPGPGPFLMPIPESATIRITPLNLDPPANAEAQAADTAGNPVIRMRTQVILKHGDVLQSRVVLSDGTKLDSWQVDGNSYAPVLGEERLVAVAPGGPQEDPFFPDPYSLFRWVGEGSYLRSEQGRAGEVWVFARVSVADPVSTGEAMEGEDPVRIRSPRIEIRVSAKTRFPVRVDIDDLHYAMDVVPGQPEVLPLPEAVRLAVQRRQYTLRQEISPLPPR